MIGTTLGGVAASFGFNKGTIELYGTFDQLTHCLATLFDSEVAHLLTNSKKLSLFHFNLVDFFFLVLKRSTIELAVPRCDSSMKVA